AGAPAPSLGAAADSMLRSVALESPEVRGGLSLDQALRLALRFNPTLAESAWHVRAAAQHARDESRPPNPTVDVTAENFGGSLGQDITETTVTGSQPLELSGARGARARVGRELVRVAQAEWSVRQREVIGETGEAFLDTWWLEQRRRHLERIEQIATATISAARERTRIGAAPPVEGLRAEATLAERQVERHGVEADLAEARRHLAFQWGAANASFDTLLLPPPRIPRLPSADSLLA